MGHAIYPGTFDPVTLGHLDVIGRAAKHFDRLTVVVMTNPKKQTLFAAEERMTLIREATADFPHVDVDCWSGLLVEGAREHRIKAIVKGLRTSIDFEYEIAMAQMNHHLAEVDTFFVATAPEYSFISSSLIKEVAGHGGSVGEFVPPCVLPKLLERLASRA
ncbi:pantetheine-phosphate adenylyltransferase [Segniliparus rugosus]|uniref:Phosphopantetheine adenylyltransferase n=1 Tax=Segniliparus rugosus (strain ATCC BAA-974 / DSM 45345 / CCUG 50838 / CIP 108380 / JCM 13579 / CDC 945) TaxID=679197 RepID=E5XUG2_SEGRC|nr:pantetheine-phosphate adenylyltransferase [Segniliparus rugosus]EFV12016.1 pantetheine-phosphate adenylyltransferase [Segniliparus rugosus ATCC BAA-974]